MPTRPRSPCVRPHCPNMAERKGRCPQHAKAKEKARGTRHQRGYDSQHEKWRELVLRRDNGLCQPCLRVGVVRAGTQADHITPFDRGGSKNALGNGQAICASCHGYKTAWERVAVEPWPETEAGA